MKPSEAAKIWTLLATAYAEGLRWIASGPKDDDGKTQLDRTGELYESFLRDMEPYSAADAAVRRVIATFVPTDAKRYPPIPVLRAAILAQTSGRPRTGLEAWGDVRKLTGSYTADRLDDLDPATRTVLETFGWIVWRTYFRAGAEIQRWTVSSESENEASDRARFAELYDRLAGRAQEDAIVGALAPPLPQRRIGGAPPALVAELARQLDARSKG